MIKLKNEKEIVILRESCHLLAELLRLVKEKVVPGVTTSELDEFAFNFIKEHGDTPAFRGYRPEGSPLAYPATLCTSLNDQIVHGIPGNRVLKEGDIISLDCGINHEGMYSDSAITVGVGEIDPKLRKLLAVTEESLYAGIKAAGPGKRMGDIGSAIQDVIESNGFNIVEELCGHGVGFAPHEDPYVPNFGKPGQGILLEPGLVIAIEPMATPGDGKIKIGKDGFSFSSRDGKASAHFEHTILITPTGVEILTK